MKNRESTLKVLLDTSFILPTLGIDTGKQSLEALRKLDETNAEIYYSKFTILESLWTAVTLQKSQKLDEETFKTGIKSIMKSGRYAKIEEIPETFNNTLKLHKLGHKDMIDNILYTSSLHLNLKLLTLDKQLKTFIQEKRLKDTLITPNQIT